MTSWRRGLVIAVHTRLSSPAKAGDPVITEIGYRDVQSPAPEITGCPAFAGHDVGGGPRERSNEAVFVLAVAGNLPGADGAQRQGNSARRNRRYRPHEGPP